MGFLKSRRPSARPAGDGRATRADSQPAGAGLAAGGERPAGDRQAASAIQATGGRWLAGASRAAGGKRPAGARGEEALFVSFGSTEGAFALKSCAAAHGLEGRLVPIPRALSAGCGVAWREPPANRTRLEEALSSEGIDYDQVVALRA